MLVRRMRDESGNVEPATLRSTHPDRRTPGARASLSVFGVCGCRVPLGMLEILDPWFFGPRLLQQPISFANLCGWLGSGRC